MRGLFGASVGMLASFCIVSGMVSIIVYLIVSRLFHGGTFFLAFGVLALVVGILGFLTAERFQKK